MNWNIDDAPSQGQLAAKPTPGSRLKSAWTCMVAAIGIAGAAVATPAIGETFPSHPVKFVIPFTPGGGTDVTTRLLAEQMSPKLGQPIVIEYRPGGSGNLGAVMVANSQPNGYTVLVGSATHASNSVIPGSNLPFDLMKDFEFIGKIGGIDLMVVTPSNLGIDSLKGLVDHMLRNPGNTQFGSAGTGTSGHLGGELLARVAKAKALHVPYKGESAAVSDLLGGRLTFMLCTASVCMPHIKDGKLKALAATGKNRSSMAPDIPTATELGLPVVAGPWWYLAAPKGTPAEVVNKLSAALNQVIADEKYRARLLERAIEVEPATSPVAVREGLLAEMERWRPVISAAGIKY